MAQQATIVGIVRSRHKDNRQACEQCAERRIGRNFSCRKFCDNCRRRENLPSGDGKTYQVEYYNLDMILSIGYRVKSSRGVEFRRWANNVLKEYLLKGYSVNRRLTELEQRVSKTEEKIDFFVRTSLPPVEGVFYDGQIFDAYKFATDLIRSAKKSILIIDGAEVWHIGASLKDLGKKMFAFSKLGIPAEAVTILL